MTETDEAASDDLLEGKRVLTVEDEGITQMQLSKILRGARMVQVGLAMNGPDGVELALEKRPDVILMDINMPGAFNGLEAARRILAHYQPCIVLLTAYTDYLEQAREAGIHGYIMKPIDRTTLLQHIREALARFRAGERLP